MKLYSNKPSPYGRKVLVTIIELGMLEKIEVVPTDPWTASDDLFAGNPVGKVPALMLDDGRVLTESTTICEYLASLSQVRTDGDGAWIDRSVRTAMAQGLMDAAYTTVIETRRPPEYQWTAWIERQRRAIDRILNHAETEDQRFDLGDISLACGLAYLDYRLPHISWRVAHSRLARWLDEVGDRESMRQTALP